MKKSLIILSALALVLSACTKSNAVQLPKGEEVSVDFSAVLTTDATAKASIDGDGAGIYADQCHLQVWWGDILFYEKTVPVTSYAAKFKDIVLVKHQKYDFLFWADNQAGAYYLTDNLKEVKLAGTYAGGKDQRDAFYAALVDKTVDSGFSETVTLHRPFAQLNVITTDLPALHEQFPVEAQFKEAIPNEVSLKVTVPTVFNVKTGVASDPKELSYTAPVYSDPIKTTSGAKNTLSMDYLFAPAEEGNLVTVLFSAKNETTGLASIDYTFANVPLRRNYRTNIIGALITVVGTIDVEIQPDWDGEIDY